MQCNWRSIGIEVILDCVKFHARVEVKLNELLLKTPNLTPANDNKVRDIFDSHSTTARADPFLTSENIAIKHSSENVTLQSGRNIEMNGSRKLTLGPFLIQRTLRTTY